MFLILKKNDFRVYCPICIIYGVKSLIKTFILDINKKKQKILSLVYIVGAMSIVCSYQIFCAGIQGDPTIILPHNPSSTTTISTHSFIHNNNIHTFLHPPQQYLHNPSSTTTMSTQPFIHNNNIYTTLHSQQQYLHNPSSTTKISTQPFIHNNNIHTTLHPQQQYPHNPSSTTIIST